MTIMMKSTLLACSLLLALKNPRCVDAFLSSLSQRSTIVAVSRRTPHPSTTTHTDEKRNVVIRWYEPLPNDSLGNYQANDNLQQQQQPSSPIPETTSPLSSSQTPSFHNNEDPSATTTTIVGPNPSLTALQVTTLLMDALQNTSNPQHSLALCFDFSSDRCRAAVGGSLTEFVKYANNPTFGSLVHCQDYCIQNVGPIIPGGMHRGDMQTILVQITKPLTVQAALLQASSSSWSPSYSRAQSDDRNRRRRPTIAERMQAREENAQHHQSTKRNKQHHTKDHDDEYVDVFTNPEEDGKKTFLWTLQKERRPPRQDYWLVQEVLYKRNAWFQTK